MNFQTAFFTVIGCFDGSVSIQCLSGWRISNDCGSCFADVLPGQFFSGPAINDVDDGFDIRGAQMFSQGDPPGARSFQLAVLHLAYPASTSPQLSS